MVKGNPNPIGREAANAALAAKYQARVEQARAWIDESDENGITPRAVIDIMPVTLWRYAIEYAAKIGVDPRTAKRLLKKALGSR